MAIQQKLHTKMTQRLVVSPDPDRRARPAVPAAHPPVRARMATSTPGFVLRVTAFWALLGLIGYFVYRLLG